MMKNDNLRFSIRKLTIGVVSVMFGALLFCMSVHPVHADTAKAQASDTLVQKKQAAPVAGENYNAKVQKTAPAIVTKPAANQTSADTTDKLSNGLESQTAVSAKNKNTNQVTTIKAANNNQAIYNSTVATDGQFTITIANKTNASQTLIGGYNIYNLPA